MKILIHSELWVCFWTLLGACVYFSGKYFLCTDQRPVRRKYFPEKTKDQKHKKNPEKAKRKQRKTGKATQVNTECQQKPVLVNQDDVLLGPETTNSVLVVLPSSPRAHSAVGGVSY